MKNLTICLILAAAAHAQTSPEQLSKQKDQGKVSGSLHNSVTNEPIRKAKVTLKSTDPSKTPNTITSDNEGKFLLENIDPGRYTIAGERQGFVNQNYGATRPMGSGSVLDLKAGKTIDNIDIKMIPQGIVAGRVLDDEGEPVAGVTVSALQYVYMSGHRRLLPSGASAMPTTTNDLGEYRISNLAPARYYIQSSAQKMLNLQSGIEKPAGKGPEEGFVPSFFPNVTDVSAASPVDVGPGAEVRGIDIRLKKVRVHRVSGVLTNGSEPVKNGVIMVYKSEPNGMSFMPASISAVQGGKGTFELRDLAPGSYSILGVASGDPQNMMMSMTKLVVGDESVKDFNINVGAGVDVPVSARIADGVQVPAGPDPAWDLGNVRVVLQIEDNPLASMSVAQMDKEHKGVLKRVNPDKYRIAVMGMPPNLYLKSARFGAIDVLQDGLDVRAGANGTLDLVLGAPAAQLIGNVQNEKGEPVKGAIVTVIPKKAGARTDLSRSGTTDQNGRYAIPGIVPAEYKVYAWEDIENGAADDDEFRKPFEKRGVDVDLTTSLNSPSTPLTVITKAAVEEAKASGRR